MSAFCEDFYCFFFPLLLSLQTPRAASSGLVSFSDPSASLQGRNHRARASGWLFIYGRSRAVVNWEGSTARSRPKFQIYLLHLSPKWKINSFFPHGDLKPKRLLQLHQMTLTAAHEFMENGWNSDHHLVFTWHFVPLFIPRCRKTIFPHPPSLLPFPGNLVAQFPLASALGITAADWDKNNYASICLPNRTRPTPFS